MLRGWCRHNSLNRVGGGLAPEKNIDHRFTPHRHLRRTVIDKLFWHRHTATNVCTSGVSSHNRLSH